MVKTSVIIPALNEERGIQATLQNVTESFASEPDVEMIVVDGGSHDATVRRARQAGARVLSSPRGRAKQMNAGAAHASADVFLFLHADSRLPPNAGFHVSTTLATPKVVAGAFYLKIGDVNAPLSKPHVGLRFIAHFANVRSRIWRKPYGDQGLFVTRSVFDRAGGFRDMPIMEDYDFVTRLGQFGRVSLVGDPRAVCLTSARRWQEVGFLRTTALNWAVVLGFHIGVPTHRLANWYRGAAKKAASSQRSKG